IPRHGDMCNDAKPVAVCLVHESCHYCVEERWHSLDGEIVNNHLDGIHFRLHELANYLPRLLLVLHFPGKRSTTKRVVSTYGRGGGTARRRRGRARNDQTRAGKRLIHPIAKLSGGRQWIARRSNGRNPITEKVGQYPRQPGPFVVSQRSLIHDLRCDQQMHVSIDQSWNDRSPTSVDNACLRVRERRTSSLDPTARILS